MSNSDDIVDALNYTWSHASGPTKEEITVIDGTDAPYKVALDCGRFAWCHEVERVPRPDLPKVGDYVRWDAADRSIWAAGILVSLGTQAARIRVESGPEGWTYTVDAESAASFRIGSGETLRRIPRPTAGERLAQEFAEFQEVPDDALHIDEARTMEFGKRLAAAAASAIAERDPLIDGLTLGECRGRWFANRARLEPAMCAGMRSPGRIVPPLEPLTPAQIAAVKAEVASDVQAWWPRQLREMVDASAAIDKARAVNVVCDSGEADE